MNLTRKPQIFGAVAAGVALAVILSACGGGGASNAASTTPTTRGGSNPGPGSGGSFPGTFGQIAAVSGSSMEVQNPQNGQVTVSWTSSTRFSKTVNVSLSSLTANDCVTVVGTTANSQLTATTVAVSQPDSSGSCTGRAGGTGAGGGAGGTGLGGRFRTGAPPAGSVPNRPAAAASFGMARGKVTSVSPTALVIFGTTSSGFRGRGSTTSTSVPDSSVTVQVNSSTRYTETQTASASDVAVNECATATGTTDSTGAVTANTIRISPAGPTGCTTGFGGFGRGAASGNG